MRVAIINWTRRRVGGAETYLGRVIPALQTANHELFFWHETDGPEHLELIRQTASLDSCCADKVGVDAAVRTLEAWQPEVLYVHGLRNPVIERALLAIGPAVLFAHGYYGTCITGSKTVQLPVVEPCGRRFGASCLALYYPRRCGGLSPVTMMTEYRRQMGRRDLLARYNAVLTFSEHMRREYLQHGVAENKVHRVPSIGESAALDGDAQPIRLLDSTASSPAVWRLAFIGRMDPLKGGRILLRALPAVRAALRGRIVLTFAGDGPDLDRCRQEAARIVSSLPDTDVEILGWVSTAGCRELLRASDVLIMPSLWPEPHGLAGLEALGQGVPVAAFAVGGIPEWLEDGVSGALAPANPPTAAGLASAIVRCLTTPAIRTATRERAREQIADRSVQQHLSALVPVLKAAAVRKASSVA
jgi:glycosyltransferase involved in cell wall biosynthesis